jgi:hypothetical protein
LRTNMRQRPKGGVHIEIKEEVMGCGKKPMCAIAPESCISAEQAAVRLRDVRNSEVL